jgi:hypothetical protein
MAVGSLAAVGTGVGVADSKIGVGDIASFGFAQDANSASVNIVHTINNTIRFT